jgi:hypothetical protein
MAPDEFVPLTLLPPCGTHVESKSLFHKYVPNEVDGATTSGFMKYPATGQPVIWATMTLNPDPVSQRTGRVGESPRIGAAWPVG